MKRYRFHISIVILVVLSLFLSHQNDKVQILGKNDNLTPLGKGVTAPYSILSLILLNVKGDY